MRQRDGRDQPRRRASWSWMAVALGVAVPCYLVAAVWSVSVTGTGFAVSTIGTWLVLGFVTARAVRNARSTVPAPWEPDRWDRARARFDALCTEYTAFECDPISVLRLPALTDTSVASTARFVEAFADAQGLHTDASPPPEHAAAFVAAVDRAERGWRAARDAAERIRLSHLDPREHATVERVIRLLSLARDTDNAAERHTAYARSRTELSRLERIGVLRLPRIARAVLDAAARGALPAVT